MKKTGITYTSFAISECGCYGALVACCVPTLKEAVSLAREQIHLFGAEQPLRFTAYGINPYRAALTRIKVVKNFESVDVTPKDP